MTMTFIRGAAGSAEKLEITPDVTNASETVTAWVINAPGYHPLWSQYMVAAVRLREVEGLPSPVVVLPGATHELFIVSINPDHVLSNETIADTVPGRFLTPINVAEQFVATDEEMEQLAQLAAGAIVAGRMDPEASNGPTSIRAQWHTSLWGSLDHIRNDHGPLAEVSTSDVN